MADGDPEKIKVTMCAYFTMLHNATAFRSMLPLGGLFELRNRASGTLCRYNPPYLHINDVFWKKKECVMNIGAVNDVKTYGNQTDRCR